MDKIVNFFLKFLSFDVFQLVVLNCEISMRIEFSEFCNFELKVFDKNDDILLYWKEIVYKRDFIKSNKMLKYAKFTNKYFSK